MLTFLKNNRCILSTVTDLICRIFTIMIIRVYVILLFATVFICYSGYAQKQEKKSYSLYKSRSATNINVLLTEAEKLKTDHPGEALNKVEEALGISIARKDLFFEGKSYLLLGEINEGISEWKLALENYNKAHQILLNQYKDTPEYMRVLRGLGQANLKLGNFFAALQFLEESLDLKLKPLDRRERQFELSEVLYQMERYNEALRTLEDIAVGKLADKAFEARVQNQKAKIYAQLQEFEKTQALYENSLNTLRANKAVPEEQAKTLQQNKEAIAGVYRQQKRYDDEIALRNQAIDYNLQSNNLSEVTNDKVEIGKTLEAKGETREALAEVQEAVVIAETLPDPNDQAKAFLTAAELYRKIGQTQEALNAYQKYSDAVARKGAMQDSLLDERATLIKKQKEIQEVTQTVSLGQREETIHQAVLTRQKLIIYGLLLIILIIMVTSYFIYRSGQASKTANQLLALKSLRSQMNPHFIFNALNSVNHFITQQDERTANKFLSEFSLLMRLVLENSQEDFIPLQKEQEILALYLKLEHYRFRDKFDYAIQIDPDINVESVEVPPMLIQPYIENAIWHGLRYKESKGHLKLEFRKSGSGVVVEISDDGIGRKKSVALKTTNQKKHKSTGLKNIHERLDILNKVYKANYKVTVNDNASGGTCVNVFLPVNKTALKSL